MKTTPVTNQFAKKGFLRGWLLVNIIGIVVGVIIAFGLHVGWARDWTLPAASEGYLENRLLTNSFPLFTALAGGILVGSLLIGWGEQMVIRRHTHLTICWFQATAIGAAIGAVYYMWSALPPIFIQLPEFRIDFLYYIFWAFGLALWSGLFIGLLQWLVLRKTVSRSGAWIWIIIESFVYFLFDFISIRLYIIRYHSWYN